MTAKIGWILVHAKEKYGKGNPFKTPIAEMKKFYKPGRVTTWQWSWPKPLRENPGPYTVLLAWEGIVFGEATAGVTREVDGTDESNFAFTLTDYKKYKPVALSDLPLGNRLRHHHSLIRLDEHILSAYQKLK